MTGTETIKAYWGSADARDWTAFRDLLSPDVVYRLPQTGEAITGRDRYLHFNMTFPGEWHIDVHRIIADGDQAMSWVMSSAEGQQQDAVTVFRFDSAGLISEVVDFWPEPYPAPAREPGVVDGPDGDPELSSGRAGR